MKSIKRLWSKSRWGWSVLFAIALSIALLFQACGGDTLSDTANSTAGEEPNSLASDPGTENTMENVVKEHTGDKPTPTPIALAEPAVPVTAESVTYATIDGRDITGYLAQPEPPASETLPAIITIHEWWGLNENIEAMTRRLAGEGYTVLAVDMYDGQVATDSSKAQDLARAVRDNPGTAQDNLYQASQFLQNEYSASALGSIGWCFGGNWSLRTGLLLGSDLDAMAIYYGQLILAPEALDALDMPVIGFFGEEDSSIAVEDVNNFESIMTDLGKDVTIHLYPEAGHAFANPSGQNYDAAAAEDAWEKTKAFFAETLQG